MIFVEWVIVIVAVFNAITNDHVNISISKHRRRALTMNCGSDEVTTHIHNGDKVNMAYEIKPKLVQNAHFLGLPQFFFS